MYDTNYLLLILVIFCIILVCQLYIYMNSSYRGKYIIVVGGGLAGLTSAITIAAEDINNKVLLIEKENVLGGNSAKASSGINGTETNLQINKGIKDSKEKFFIDTYKSAGSVVDGGSKQLMGRLVLRSAEAINWLKNNNVTFDEINILGGHSVARTHRDKNEIHVGSYIINTLVEKIQLMSNIKVMTGTSVDELMKRDDSVIGVRCDYKIIYADAVIIATGGFAHNFNMISTYRPDISTLPTTNGKWALGEGVNLSVDAGASLVDMEKIQIHPTGFVDINDKNNKTKYLAAELLRGIGGILLNSEGERFCNELGTRTYVTNRMMEQNQDPKEFLLVIPSTAYNDAKKTIDYYISKDLLRKYNIKYISKRYNVNEGSILNTMNKYNNKSLKSEDEFGKKNFPNVPFNINDDFYVGLVTPSIHYCMGGIRIDKNAQVLKSDNTKIDRLFAVGEVTGGLHGDNRLGGNSLLECVVYGRIAGFNAINIPNLDIVSESYNDYVKEESDDNNLQDIDRDELEKHKQTTDAWTVIYDKVYDVTELISSHPGGADSILSYAGRDATSMFEKIHSKNLLNQMKVVGKYIGTNDKN